MTNCSGLPAEQNVEAYVMGRLPEEEAARFEDHFFDCAVCLAQVEALQTVRLKLREMPRRPVKAPIPWPVRLVVPAAIAAALVVGYFGFRAGHSNRQPSVATGPVVTNPAPVTPVPAGPAAPTPAADGAVAQMADLRLPVFRASNLRGESSNPHFDAGMKSYAAQDCAGAVKSLAQVPADDQDALAAHFYTGACLLHEGDLARAAKSLGSVANAGDSPQQEAALYYLAQAALAGNNMAAARRGLARTIALHGDFEKRAQAQLKKLPSAQSAQ